MHCTAVLSPMDDSKTGAMQPVNNVFVIFLMIPFEMVDRGTVLLQTESLSCIGRERFRSLHPFDIPARSFGME